MEVVGCAGSVSGFSFIQQRCVWEEVVLMEGNERKMNVIQRFWISTY